ncbi:2-hydroxychromene-2-carboxylate isomerase [bacterium]|nr:2-hydroxychromene-2-carboxylate isomerase [bacterium]
MSKQLEFFFDYVSPATFLAYTQLPAIIERTGAELIYRPFLLGGVFKSSGNSSPMSVPAKGTWLLKDLTRFSKRYNVPMKFNPYFPINTIQLMRGAIWAGEQNTQERYSTAMFRAVWLEEKNMNDPAVVSEVLKSIQIDPEAFVEATSRQSIKDKLRANTDEAVSRGAFGAPTMFVGEEMFFGQDRLDFVEEALLT